MRQALGISERRAFRLAGLYRSTLRRVITAGPASASLETRIVDIAHARRRFGRMSAYRFIRAQQQSPRWRNAEHARGL
jgi:hypothetical protein